MKVVHAFLIVISTAVLSIALARAFERRVPEAPAAPPAPAPAPAAEAPAVPVETDPGLARALDAVAAESLGDRGVIDDPSVKSWSEFYEATRILGISDVDLLRQIVARLAGELQLPHVDRMHLEQLLITEQLAVTKEALRRYRESIAVHVASKDAAGDAFWDELRQVRQSVRDRFEIQYLNRFTPEQRTAINRELRNDKIRVTEYKSGSGSKFLVSGFGR